MIRTLLLLTLLAPTAAAAFIKPPRVHDVQHTSAGLVWQASKHVVTTVDLFGGDTAVHATAPKPNGRGMVVHRIEGLKPDTQYRYQVSEAGGATAEGRFVTQPSAGRPFTFVVYGDNRSDHMAHMAVVKGIRGSTPDLLVNTGDLVGHGGREMDWMVFFQIEAPLLAEAPLYPTVGNHERYGDGHYAFARYFPMASPNLYYAFTWGNVRFVMIDGEVNIGPDGHGPDRTQRAWLLSTLRAAKADPAIDHIVGVIHRGPFSSHPQRRGNTALRDMLPELQEAGLTLVLSGHDHFYERGMSHRGLPYIVIGGGGAPLYQTMGAGKYDDYTAAVSRSVHHHVRFRSSGATLSACAVDLSGASFDCFTLPGRKK